MRISVITENANLVQYLRTNPSVIVENVYTELGSEYDRFINDLNSIDILLMIDYSDQSVNLARITQAVQSGNAYLLKVQEIVLVTLTDFVGSPTPNAKDKFNAFVELMRENRYAVRIVQFPQIEFHSVYEAIIKETTIEGNGIEIFEKYKVYKSSGGIDLKPTKSKTTLAPDKNNERPAMLRQDRATIEMMADRVLTIPEETSGIVRSNITLSRLDTVDAQTTPLILVTGVKYSGKSTFCIRALAELHKNGFSSLVVDSTGRDDLTKLLRFNNSDFPVLRGSDIFIPPTETSVGVQLAHLSPTASFLSSLKHLSNSKACIFCEVDLDYYNNYLCTYTGKKILVAVSEYDFVKLRDLAAVLNGVETDVVLIINTREVVADAGTVQRTVREFLPSVEAIGFITDMVEAVSFLGV